MNHWKSANFGSDKHPKLSPPQFFADGGRAGSDGQWWKIVCMYGAHVRSDQSLVNGSHFDCVGYEGSANESNFSIRVMLRSHAQEGRQRPPTMQVMRRLETPQMQK